MRVVMGLSHDSRYWERVGHSDKAAYLSERAQQNAALAHALARTFAKSRAVAGWYISEEIDDLNWNDAVAHRMLTGYLQGQSVRLAAIRPARPVSVSAFTNAGTSPDELGRQWKRRLRDVPGLARLYFQDGVGVGKLALGDVPAYYGALRQALAGTGVELVPVVEVFTQVAGAPIDDQPYAAVPANPQRLLAQVQAARRAGKVASFGVPEYLSPVGSVAAGQAYAAWVALLESRNEQCGGE
jgi:hypothetical protein